MELIPQLRDPLESVPRKIRESCRPHLPSFSTCPTGSTSVLSPSWTADFSSANKDHVASFHRYQREFQKRNQRRRLQQYHRVEHTILDSPIWPFTLARNREVSCISTFSASRIYDCYYSLPLLAACPVARDSSSI